MNEDSEAYTSIAERLVHLERQNKRLRLAVGGTAAGLILAVVVMVMASRTGALLKTRQLEIIDRSGNRRAVIRTLPNGEPTLVFYDAASNVRLSLGLGSELEPGTQNARLLPETPRLAFFDDEETPRLTLGVDMTLPPLFPGPETRQMTGLALYDADGTDRADITVDGGGIPRVRLRDKVEWVNMMMSVRSDGTPALTLYDLDKSVAEFGVKSGGKPYLSLTRTWGRGRTLTP